MQICLQVENRMNETPSVVKLAGFWPVMCSCACGGQRKYLVGVSHKAGPYHTFTVILV